jgi:hypothetical protein
MANFLAGFEKFDFDRDILNGPSSIGPHESALTLALCMMRSDLHEDSAKKMWPCPFVS